ncbi:F-box protein PP2-A15-like [Vigna angularis]|uniref:F-box protein PP2-A15-like n=1 Tax=Phaseolus angularis TaxID=3914 RepID=UPI0022B41F8C|nr:F-box protein PP2-A15-like [Vigna angularis]
MTIPKDSPTVIKVGHYRRLLPFGNTHTIYRRLLALGICIYLIKSEFGISLVHFPNAFWESFSQIFTPVPAPPPLFLGFPSSIHRNRTSMHHRHQRPPEICNLARLNRAFRGAASSDSVWEAKLPRNYQDLLDLFPPERHRNLSKKDIFALLSRPLPFDDGHKVGGALQEVWLDRVTGRVCMSISARAMAITGIDDRRYWNWIPTEESRLDLLVFKAVSRERRRIH